MEQKGDLIQKTFRSILIVNMVSIVSGIAAVMIDAVIIGQFLGTDAVAAMGLTKPVVLGLNFFGAIFGPGMGIVCTRYMGMARPDRVKQVFGFTTAILTAFGTVCSILLFVLSPQLTEALRNDSVNAQTSQMAESYLKGFAPGILPQYLFMAMSGLMVLDNDKKRSLIGMFVNLGGNILFDLLNVLVFKGGMFGMAVSTTLSFVAGLAVVLTHFLKKRRVLSFTWKGWQAGDLKEVVLCGAPAGISLGSKALLLFLFNFLLLKIGGQISLSAYSACSSLLSPVEAVGRSIFVTTATLCSLLYGENDRNGITRSFRTAIRASFILYAVISVLMIVFAGAAARLFLDASAQEEIAQAKRLIQFTGIQCLLMSVSFPLSGAWQGTRRMPYNYIMDILRDLLMPVICCTILGIMFDMKGFEIGLSLSGVLILLAAFLIPAAVNRRPALQPESLLMLPSDFGGRPEDMFEASMRTMQDVSVVSEKIMQFCKQKGTDTRSAMMISLFVEEVAGNVVRHGFPSDEPGFVDVRYVWSEDRQIIRFRDNGTPFDPVEWLRRNNPEDKTSCIGIRLAVKLSHDFRYIPAMGLNNLMIKL